MGGHPGFDGHPGFGHAGGRPGFGRGPERYGFHGRDVHRFGDHDLAMWRGGHWGREYHNGRYGWWWNTGGGPGTSMMRPSTHIPRSFPRRSPRRP